MEKTVKAATTKAKTATKTATKAVKETAQTVTETTTAVAEAVVENTILTPESMNKVKATAEVINTEIKNAATEITNDLKEVAKDMKTVAKKVIVGKATKADLNKGVKSVKDNAKEIREQIAETTNKVVAEVKETGVEIATELKETTTKLAKEAIENVRVTDRLNSLKNMAVKANDYALETSEEMIDGFAVNSEKWQKVAEKAIKNSLKVAEKQQNMMFTTLEAVKTQLTDSGVRFRKLVGFEKKAKAKA